MVTKTEDERYHSSQSVEKLPSTMPGPVCSGCPRNHLARDHIILSAPSGSPALPLDFDCSGSSPVHAILGRDEESIEPNTIDEHRPAKTRMPPRSLLDEQTGCNEEQQKSGQRVSLPTFRDATLAHHQSTPARSKVTNKVQEQCTERA